MADENEEMIEVEIYGKIERMTPSRFAEYQRQRSDNAHVGYMKDHVEQHGLIGTLEPEDLDVKEVKQSMRRMAEIEKVVNQTVVERIAPGSAANVEYISFEMWAGLAKDWKQAIDAGESQEDAFERVGYMPVPAYINKLMPEGKKAIRPLFQHEVGVRPTGKILLLEDRFPGDVGSLVVPVAEDLSNEPD